MAVEVASLKAVLSLDKSDFDRGIRTSTGLLEKLGNVGVGMGVDALTGAFTSAGRAMADSVKMGADLEKQIDSIGAVTNASTDDLEQLAGLITALGLDPKLTVSMFQSADAVEMLARNGLTVDDIMQGAAKSTVSLANAAGGDFAQSADIMTDAVSLFSKEFRDSQGNIRNLEEVVDGITGVVQSSKFSVDDYALALANAGGVAADFGVEFTDFNAVLAATASYFSSGADAGTALKVFMQRLAAPTDKAIDLMAEMGLEVYDAAGNLLPMIDIVDNLNDTFKRMDEQTRGEVLTALFGSDATRIGSALANMTREQFAAIQAQVEQADAAQAAAARVDNLTGAMDRFAGVIEGIQVGIGQELTPALKDLLDNTLTPLAAEVGPELVDTFGAVASNLADFITAASQADSPVMELGQALQTGLIEPGAELAKALTGLNGELSTTDTVMQSIKVVSDEMSPALNTFGSVLGILTGIVNISNTAFEKMDKSLESVGLKVDSGKVAIQGMLDAALGLLIPVTSLVNAFETLSDSVTLITTNWDGFKRVLEDEIGLPDWLVPGSPTPFETGLRGISDAISSMPDLAQALPGGSSGNNARQTTILNMGGQQFSFTGQNGKEEALAAMLQMLRQQLNAA